MKKHLTFIFLLCGLLGEHGYAQQLMYQKLIGGNGIDYAYDMHHATIGGGYFFGGVSSSFPVVGGVASYVVRTDINADTLWTASYVGPGGSCDWQYVNDICPLSDGGCVTVGGKTVCGDTTVGGNMVRLDANGNLVWAKYNATFADPYPVIQSSDGNIIVGGYIKGKGAGGLDAFLSKLDANGDTLWTKNYGGAVGDEWFYHILQTSDGGYLAAGKTTSFGQGGQDIYLVKTDGNGNLQWSKAYGTAGYEVAFGHSLEPTADGGFILAGQGDTGGQSAHGVFLMKIDAAGTMTWANYYDGRDGHAVKQSFDGGFVVTGRSTAGVQLIKTDVNGALQWSKVYTAGTSEKGLILELANDGGFVLGGQGAVGGNTQLYIIKTDSLGNSGCNESNAGVTSSAAPFVTVNAATLISSGDKTVSYPVLFQRGGSVSSLCTTVGLNSTLVPADQFFVYPNPANGGNFYIAHIAEHCLIKVLNVYGQEVNASIIKENGAAKIHVTTAGAYFVYIHAEGKTSMLNVLVGNE